MDMYRRLILLVCRVTRQEYKMSTIFYNEPLKFKGSCMFETAVVMFHSVIEINMSKPYVTINNKSRFITKYKYNDFVLSWRNNATTSRHQRRQGVGDSRRCSLDRESGILPLSHCASTI